MRKSFTRLFSLVMFLTLLSTVSMAALTSVWPSGATALTKTTDKIQIVYPEAVQASTGSVRVTKTSGGALVAVLPATDSRISYAKGDTVLIDLSASLQELTDYTVTLDLATFKTVKDGTDQATYTWAFTTGDYTAPVLDSFVPVNGTTLTTAQTTVALEMTFKDASPVLAGTGKVAIYKADGNLWDFLNVTSTTSVTSLGSNLYKIVMPTSRVLEDNTTYNVTIDAGTVADNGQNVGTKPNKFAGLTNRTVWAFTTKDYSAPGYASGYPKKGTVTNTAAGVLIKTAEVGKAYAVINTSATALDPLTGIKNAAGVKSVTITTAGTEYSIDFTSPVLTEGIQYYIHVATENGDGILSTAEAQVAVKTSEITAPTLAAVEYFKGTTTQAAGTVAANVVTTSTSIVAIPASFGGGFAIPQDVNNIVLTFSEDVKIGAGNVTIYKASDNTVFATVAAASLTLAGDVASTTVVETPQVKIPVSGLQNNTKYYVTMPNTLVLDAYDNKYAGISAVNAWVFTTNDKVVPTFTYTPAEGALAQKQDVSIVLTFNELIRPYGAFTLATALTVEQYNPATATTTIATGTITTSDNDGKFTTITIAAPAGGYASSANVTVKIALNSLADVGNKIVDVAGQGINFVVEDKVAPLIVEWSALTSPSKSEVLKFDEAIYLAGGGEITDATLASILTVKQTDISGVNIPYTATIDAAKKVITITPVTPWVSEKVYYFAITSSLQDAAGNLFQGVGRTSTQTIADVTAATVDLSSVAGKTISTADPITLVFKEGSAVEARTSLFYNNTWNAYAFADLNKVIVLKEGSATGADVLFTVTNDVATFVGDNATFAIHATLVGNKTYYLGVGASTKGGNGAGTINVANFVTFTTKEEGVPTVSSKSPADNATQVDKASSFVLTYNTDVVKKVGFGTGDIYITDGTTPILVTDAEVSISGAVVTINPIAELDTDKSYDIVIAAGAFTNKNLVTSVSGAIATDTWDFKTTDTKLGLIALSPDNTATASSTTQITPIDSKLVMTFDEKAVKALGTIKIWNMATNLLVESIDVVSSQVVLSEDQKVVTITPAAKFSYNSTYYVEVAPGTFKDEFANGNLEIYGTTNSPTLTNWTFGTPNPALAIVKTTPANGADKVSATSSIVVEFNREIAAVAGNNSVGYYEGLAATSPQSYILGSSNVVISGKTLTISHPDKVFPADMAMYLYLPAGVIKAANDPTILNSLVNQTSSTVSFNTGDVNAPIPTFTPAAFVSGSPVYTAVNSNITITFDEDIFNIGGTAVTSGDVNLTGVGALFTISPTVSFSGTISGKTVTLDPTSDLSQFTEYTVSIVGDKIKDSKGTTITTALVSANPTKYTSTFWTADTSAPVITSFVLTGGNKLITVPAITITDPNKSKFYYLVRVKSTDAAPTAAQIKAANNKSATSGTVATFNLSSLVASTAYQFYYVADDTFGNTSDVAVLEASTEDTVAPLLVSTTPATAAVDVDVPAGGVVVKLTFNENVAIGTGVITVRDYATQAILNTLTAGSLTTTTSDNKSLNLTIPAATFTNAPQKVYVEISAGTVKDVIVAPFVNTPNDFIGLFGMDALAFTSEDNQAPTVDAANSTKGTEVALDANIMVAFSENVKAGTANLILYKGSVSLANAIQVFTPAEATFSGKTATVNPTANLINNQMYVVSAETGFAKDLSSNSNASVASVGVTFTSTVNVNLLVTTVSPTGTTTAINKSTLGIIGVTFSGPVYLTVAGYHKPLALMTQAELLAHVSLVDGAGAAVAISQINKVGADGISIVTGTDAVKDQTNYTLTISGFENSAGTVMVSKVVSYLTGDNTPPVITFSPAKSATKVDPAIAGLTLTFSETFYADVINADQSIWAEVNSTNVKNFVYLREASNAGTDVPATVTLSGKVITIVPTAKLKSGVVYFYGMLLPVEDITQAILNPFTANSEVSFTTADVTAPTLATFTSTNHKPQGVGTTSTADMYVDFNENITVSTGSIVIRHEDGTIFQTISGADLSVGSSVTTAPLDSKRLLIKHNAFESFTNYFVEVGASVVVDGSGNGNVKFSDPLPATGWLFTTNDTYALTANVTPTGANTPRSVNLELTFNKATVTGQANKYINVYKADGTAVSHVLASSLVANGRVVSVPVALEAKQSYYARVEAGAFTDGSNAYAGIMDNSWTFSTVEDIAPAIVTLLPADNAVAVDATTSTFAMTFDRNIALGTGVISVRYTLDGKVFEDVNVSAATLSGTTVSFNLSKVLDSNTSFYVYVPAGAVTNTEITKDPFGGILNTYTWNFTTATDLSAPKLLTWTPNATTIADNHPMLMMTFDENVMLGAGNIKIMKASDNSVAVTIPVTAAMVSGKTVSATYSVVAPATGLDKNTDYYVLVDAGIVKDAAGNTSVGVTATTTWTFKTGAVFVTPVVDPIDNSLEFKVYPNPFVDYVLIDNYSELTKVVVSNIAGQTVKVVLNPEHEIQLNVGSGVYFISLYQGNAVIKTVKIVKR